MKYRATLIVQLSITLACPGCATLSSKERLALSAGIGASVGTLGGLAFSPNDESRGLNALVFGLGGALLGGAVGLWLEPNQSKPNATTLKDRDQGAAPSTQEFIVRPDRELPEFLKSRVKPAIIEEYLERDSLTEDGSLREPHKVYRIKRPTELTPAVETTNLGAEK